MASNVSNLLKEKIVTPVANSVAAQVDNKVKNGIILRKFIGVQLGESNTGCQLVKIDLNKINVKDPSYEFTLYIKAFSQKGLFNFIVNVNKTDSLQVDVKCEVKNSDSSNGEAIGFYDVDAVGNTITISLVKAFVVNTSINECKFVSTKDTLMISDLDIDWSDTGNVKNDTSIDIKGKESTIEIDVDKYLNIDCGTLGENQRYRIATIDYSKLSEAKYFDGTSGSSTGNSIGCFVRIKIASNLMGMMILEFRPLLLSIIDLSSARVILESKGMLTFSIDSDRGNIGAFLYKRENKSIQIFYNNDLFPTTSKDTIHVFSCEIISLNAKLDPDTIKVTFDMDTTIVTDTLNEIDLENDMNLYKVFTTDINSMGGPSFNGLVPGPNKNEAENKYLLGADAKWHPRKAVNDSFIDLEPDDTIKGLDIEDATKAVSFVTFNFNNIVTKLTELSKNSTKIYFEMELETTGNTSDDYHINGSFMVNKSGLIPTTVYTSPLTKIGNVNGYFDNPSVFYNEIIDTPGFYIMDSSLKTVTFALYTVFANSTVRIKDFYIHVDESVISLEDLTIEWKLLAIDKPEWVVLRVQKFINGSLIPPTRIFEQMNIETPIDEADSFTLEKERVKNNGLVPAPGKYEVDNGYVLGADAKWHPRKAGNEYIADLKPTEEIKGLSETDTTKGISFVTIDFNTLSQKVVEAAPSTLQEFDINMKVLTRDLGIITISTSLSVTTAGLVACTGVLSDRGMGRNSVSFSTKYSGKLGAVTTPGFFVNDRDTKILKIALYTPIAIDGVKIIDVVVTSYSDIINESDIVFTWELGILEKKPYKPLTSNIIYPRIDLDRELVFDQMDIETPISETDEDTLFAEQIKHNGLVPAPGKYEVDNGYYLKADGTWDLPKRQVQDAIATVTPTSEMISQVEAAKTTKLISFLTIDVNEVASTIEKAERFVLSLDVLTNNFGLVRIGFNLMITATGNSNISSFSSNLGTNLLPVQLTHISKLKDYGVETMSPIFAISDTNNKGIFNIGFNGNTMKEKVIVLNMSCIPKQSTVEYKAFNYIFEPTLIDLDSSTTIRRLNSTMIGGYMDPSKIFTPISTITSEDIVSETDPYELSIEKMRNNGFVPAPAKYEADQGRVLCADGTWKKMESGSNFTAVPITLDPTKYQEAYETQTNPDTSKKTIMFMNLDISSIVATGTNITKIELSMYSPIYGTSRLVIDTMINSIKNRYCVNEDANGAGFYMDYCLAVAEVENSGFTGKDDTKIESFYTFVIDGDIIKIGISPIIFKLLNGTTPPFPIVTLEDCKVFIQSITDGSTSTDISEIPISYEQSTYTLNSVYGANHNGWIAKNTIFSAYVDYDTRDFQSLHNGLVPAPTKVEVEEGKFLKADGTWAIPPSTRGNDNYITKVERDPSTVDQVSATKATSFLTIDYSTICEQLGAATGDAGQADANIFTSLEVMVPVWGKIQISIVSLLSDNLFSVLVYSDAGTGWYTDNIAYKIHSDISDNELHTRPGFYTMDDVNKTITLGMYGSYGADEIAIIDCTSIAVGEGFSVDDMIYNYDRQLIDIPESAKDFDEIGITRNTVFQSMAYADTDPDGTKYLYQRGNYNGLVPAPAKYDVTHNYMLRPNGTWGPIEGIIRNRTFTVTPYTDSSSTQTNDYVITEGAEDLAIAINENYSVDINIVFSGLGTKNNTNTTLTITGVTGTVNLYDCSGNPIKYITDGMSMKCTIFKNTIDDPVESMNAYCVYDIISYPDTINGPSE